MLMGVSYRHLYDADAGVVRTVPPQPALRHGVGVQPVLGEEEVPRAGAALQRLADVVRPPPSMEIGALTLVVSHRAGNRSHFYIGKVHNLIKGFIDFYETLLKPGSNDLTP